jgi:hypothetical protein
MGSIWFPPSHAAFAKKRFFEATACSHSHQPLESIPSIQGIPPAEVRETGEATVKSDPLTSVFHRERRMTMVNVVRMIK